MHMLPLLGFWTPGPMELAVIAVIALLIFGRRLPEIMRGLGGSVREFRKGIEDGPSDDKPTKESKQVDGTQARDANANTDAGEQDAAPRDDERRL